MSVCQCILVYIPISVIWNAGLQRCCEVLLWSSVAFKCQNMGDIDVSLSDMYISIGVCDDQIY